MRYCPYCDRLVKGERSAFNWAIFLLLCLTGIGGVVYLVYYLFKSKKVCPICGGKTKRKKPEPKHLTNE